MDPRQGPYTRRELAAGQRLSYVLWAVSAAVLWWLWRVWAQGG